MIPVVEQKAADTPSYCPTTILTEAPAHKDAFGAHQRIAQALARLIQGGEDGKAVALIGSRGSGKSSVIHILKHLLDSPDKSVLDCQVSLFDAWTHEGDPLRVTFLDHLVKDLKISGWGTVEDQQSWEENLEIVSKRRQTNVTTTQPFLKPIAFVLFYTALLAPLFLTLFKDFWDEGNNSSLAGGMALILSPALIGGLFVFLEWSKWGPKFNWRLRRWGYNSKPKDANLWALAINKSEETVRAQVLRTPDPTSVEFQKTFSDIMSQVLTQAERRFVVVIDNLDRVDTKTALVIWGTMQAFFDRSHHDDADWRRRFWLIVPFDPGTPQRLWQAEESEVSSTSSNRIAAATPHEQEQGPLTTEPTPPVFQSSAFKGSETAADPAKKGEEKDRARKEESLEDVGTSFVDKTFQIVFHVSPPLLPDYKQFLISQLKIAFPQHQPEEDFANIFHLYDLEPGKGMRSTPRDIKVFINKIGALHLQWGDTIPLPVQALYVLKHHYGRTSLSRLMEPDALAPAALQVIPPEWPKYFAALYFNVEPDKALQASLEPDIAEALHQGDADKLSSLRNIYGFWEVLENYVRYNGPLWAQRPTHLLALAALTIDGLARTNGSSVTDGVAVPVSSAWRRIWNTLHQGALSASAWGTLDEQTAQGLLTILRHGGYGSEALVQIVQVIAGAKTGNNPEHAARVMPTTTSAAVWSRGVAFFIRTLHDEGNAKILHDHFRVFAPHDAYLQVVRSLADQKVPVEIMAYFIPSGNSDEVVQIFVRSVQQGEIKSQRVTDELRLMVGVWPQWSWQLLYDALAERFRSLNTKSSSAGAREEEPDAEGKERDIATGEIPQDELVGCLDAIRTLAYVGRIQAALDFLKGYAESDAPMDLFGQAQALNDPKAIACYLLPVFECNPTAQCHSAIEPQRVAIYQSGLREYNKFLWEPDHEAQLIDEITGLIVAHNGLDLFLNQVRSAPHLTLLAYLLLKHIDTREDADKPRLLKLNSKNRKWLTSTLLLRDIHDIASSKFDRSHWINRIVEHGFSPPQASFYEKVLLTDEFKENKPFRKFLERGLSRVSHQTWRQELQENGMLLSLLLKALGAGFHFSWGKNFTTILLEHARQLDTSQNHSTSTVTLLDNLPNVLATEWQAKFWDALREFIIARKSYNRKVTTNVVTSGVASSLTAPSVAEPSSLEISIQESFQDRSVAAVLAAYGNGLLCNGTLEMHADQMVGVVFVGIANDANFKSGMISKRTTPGGMPIENGEVVLAQENSAHPGSLTELEWLYKAVGKGPGIKHSCLSETKAEFEVAIRDAQAKALDIKMCAILQQIETAWYREGDEADRESALTTS
jgi:hypothetical protein